ncbi:hypothetical protein MMC25_006931 [Agyrium rufum]|nr:hypothetical protein [Agyrium rufum]
MAMPFLYILWLTLSLSLMAKGVYAQFNFTSEGCVAPEAFDSCMSQATNEATQCFNKNCNSNSGECQDETNCFSSDPLCAQSCICAIGYQSWINCAVENCWNRAYSCEYQELVINAVMACDEYVTLEFPPYFLPPADAPGSCSCQTGLLFTVIHNAVSVYNRCEARVHTSMETEDCSCCSVSQVESTLAATCPNIDPSTLPFYSQLSNLQNSQSTFEGNICGPRLNDGSINCGADPYDFGLPNNGTFYGPANLPSPGSATPSDLAGQLTAPVAATTVWSFGKAFVPSTAVAAAFSGSAASSSASGSTKGSTSGSSGGTATATTSGAVSTSAGSKSSGGVRDCGAPGLALLLVFVTMGIFFTSLSQ